MLRAHFAAPVKNFFRPDCGDPVHSGTNLRLRSDPRYGYFVEIENYSILDQQPLTVREDMPAIGRISYQEVLDDSSVVAAGCGIFTCENGTVIISERAGFHGMLEVNIVASGVDNFNATVQALRNGELKSVGSDKTVVEKLSEKIDGLQWKVEMYKHQIDSAVNLLNNKEREIHLLKTRGWWRRLWNLPAKSVEVDKGGPGDDCIP